MPRKEHWCNGGAVGTEMTPLMVRYVLAALRYQDSEHTRQVLGVSREALLTMIRYMERKTKMALFLRCRGRGNSRLTPAPAASQFFEWCKANPGGGTGWKSA